MAPTCEDVDLCYHAPLHLRLDEYLLILKLVSTYYLDSHAEHTSRPVEDRRPQKVRNTPTA